MYEGRIAETSVMGGEMIAFFTQEIVPGIPLWIVVWIGVAFLGFVIYKAMRLVKLFLPAKANRRSDLEEGERVKIALSALYGEQLGAYTNDLATGLAKDRIFDLLGLYGIDAMTRGGLRGQLIGTLERFLSEQPSENSYSRENIDLMLSESWIEKAEDAYAIDTNAWYSGRAAMLARMGFDVKLLDEKEAFGYIDRAYLMAKKHYRSWRAFGIGYVVGRMNWSNDDEFHDIFAGYLKKLLESKDSVWNQLHF